MDRLKILIIGGYGVFGGRLVDLLSHDARLTLVVGGRSAAKATAFVASRGETAATLEGVEIDRNGDVAGRIKAIAPDIVVDASGPFQTYGETPYRVVEACIAHGVHYLDLADGASFVHGVAAFDDAAMDAGVFVRSGVSTCPVLTAAVVERLSEGLARIDTIEGGIAPSPRAVVGGNVVRAIASYAGRAVPVRRDGVLGAGHTFTETRRVTVAPPGRLPLTSRLFSLADVPDLLAMSDVRPEVRDVWFGAGPIPVVLHRMLIAFAWLVRAGILRSLTPLAGLMDAVMRRARWGEHRGGMFVRIAGADEDGEAINRSWHLIAEGDDGPYIPSMATAAIVRGFLEGRRPADGARSGIGDVKLADYEALFAERAIFTGVREEGGDLPVYAEVLGGGFADLPGEIVAMHDVSREMVAEGRANVARGSSPLAKLAASVIGFPPRGEDVPVRVTFSPDGRGETWKRAFGETSFSSRQYAGRGRSAHLVVERFGPLAFAMAIVTSPAGLDLVVRRWSAFGVPLPLWLAPRSVASERVEDGKFRFDVEISHPLTGRIVHYSGWLGAPTTVAS